MSSSVRFSYTFPGGQRLEIAQGDLTEEPVDAIVNAANAQLQHGGGVARAIVQKGGWVIQEESNAWVRKHGSVRHDRPAFTSAGKLPCRYIIHAVGPVWGEGDEDTKLGQAVRGSLQTAVQLGLTSLALPAISTGIFGFPKDRAAQVIRRAITDYFAENPESSLRVVRITLFDSQTLDIFLRVFGEHE